MCLGGYGHDRNELRPTLFEKWSTGSLPLGWSSGFDDFSNPRQPESPPAGVSSWIESRGWTRGFERARLDEKRT
jgi:hypothetical protein